ncbi:hypothetical protein TrRE_jg6644 [Triparma retinervis]|uniref:Phytanoyl-CoA dioxygenase n=1 Tax=Triparma retinervis TaxID=2557542 RepID=A0A9W7AG79_9STRA|nr:hypothetical protein TrRE_jg6644 [Triparma retinervis]
MDEESLSEGLSSSGIKSIDEIDKETIADLRAEYQTNGIVRLDLDSIKHLFPTASSLRRWTEEVAYESDLKKDDVLRTFETTAAGLRKLTRLEHFVHSHDGWRSFCDSGSPLSCLVGLVCNPGDSSSSTTSTATATATTTTAATTTAATSVPYPLYKEKLNLKPPLGSGFAPHLDAPSLKVVGLSSSFVTVMVAIDDMTIPNGCLRVVNGSNPDGDGRRGAIPQNIADELQWDPITCKGGSVYVFNGWIPHRSAANNTSFSRRAIFLTYNPAEDGELRELYYDRMKSMRDEYKRNRGGGAAADALEEEDWLSTVPS